MRTLTRSWLRFRLFIVRALYSLDAEHFTALAERLSARRRAIEILRRRIALVGAHKPSRKLELVDLYRKNGGL